MKKIRKNYNEKMWTTHIPDRINRRRQSREILKTFSKNKKISYRLARDMFNRSCRKIRKILHQPVNKTLRKYDIKIKGGKS